jgi:hypothetical protein
MKYNWNGELPDYKLGKKVFGKCPYCGGKVVFSFYEGKPVYKCEYFDLTDDFYNKLCTAYVFAHEEDVADSLKFQPKGILADNSLRADHIRLREYFNKLWISPVKPVPIHALECFYLKAPKGYAKRISKGDDEYLVEYLNGKEAIVPKSKTEKITARTKTYIWLSKQMGLSVEDCKIHKFSHEQVQQAIEIINNVI